MIVSFILLDLIILNRDYVKYKLNGLETQSYSIKNGKLFGFEIVDDKLIALHEDPNITITPINTKVGYISINCTNPNPNANAQVFFRKEGEQYNEDNSIIFSMTSPANNLALPEIQNINSIRFDLTNQTGDSIACQEFIINPPIKFHFGRRLALLFSISFLLTIGFSQINPRYKQTIKEKFKNHSFWLFFVIIIVMDLVYPLTITWDSGHYLWLADIIKEGNWADWDPIRYLLFPLILYFSQELFGLNQNALLMPMIFSHLILFSFSYLLLKELFQAKNRKILFFTQVIVFVFIALDATIVGYFHTLLTEYLAATIAVLSTFAALKLYTSNLFSKQFFWWTLYFLVMVPFAWHLKQPFIGAAYFPFILSCFLITIREFSKKTFTYGLIANLLILILVLLSTFTWKEFLISEGNPMRAGRQFSTMLKDRVDKNFLVSDQPLIEFGKDFIKKYLVSINFLSYDRENKLVIYEPCVNCGYQNTIISHRMYFHHGETNTFFSPPYNNYTNYYKTNYFSPIWLNGIYQTTSKISNFLFTITNLINPLFFVLVIVKWIRRKNLRDSAFILLSGTSLFNTLIHIIALGYTLDRYLFITYPLNLLIIAIFCIHILISIFAYERTNNEKN